MHRLRFLPLLCAITIAAASCHDSSTGSESSIPATLDVVSGDGQEGPVGLELPTSLTVRVRNADGHPVAGQLVSFRVVEGGGSMFAGAALTDRDGIARDRWTLGTSTTGNQRAEARAVESSTGNPLLFGVFHATAKPGAAASLERVTTSPAEQVVGSASVPVPAVRALDQYGNPVSGVAVTFVASAGSIVTGGSVATGATGVATVGSWTLATAPGTNTLTASATGLTPVSFTTTGTIGAATQLTKRSADPQSATVATTVTAPPSVTVLDTYGNPVSGVAVTFVITAGSGVLTGAAQTSDALGVATLGSWRLGTTAGANALEARAAGNVATFTATGMAGAPATVTKIAGDNQTAEVGTAVAVAPKVRVTDQYGNVVAGADVTFTVDLGGGTVAPRTVATQADGSASPVSWTLGTVVGTNRLSATAGTAPAVTFGATAQNAQGSVLSLGAVPAFAFPGAGLGITIQIRDAFGNPVAQPGLTVTAAIASGPSGASLAGSTATTGTTGAADFSELKIFGADGPYTIRFTASGTTGVTSRTIAMMHFTTFAPGSWHTCALDAVGAAYCWGNNQMAQLGDGTSKYSTSSEIRVRPGPVAGGQRFTDLQSGSFHTCGLTAAGAMYCWGDNSGMQLGNGTNVTPLIPVLVGGGLQFVQIATGDSHSCGLTAAGAAYCWGQNVYGQLGDGTTVSRGVPTPVAGGLVFTSLTAGTLHSCGLVADGSAYCWGLGEAGNLGASPTETCVDGAGPRGCNRSPMAVTGGFRFSAITAANSHTCALDAAGVAYCWGGNEGGELGDGISGLGVLRVTPAPVSSAERFVRISAGGSITCALNAAGKGFCWGRQSLGGLGDGTITTRNVPTAVAGGHSFSTIEAPATFLGATCGATTAGTPLCWAGDRGQAGTGTVPGPRVPTPVKLPE